jgi:hypothetical protein
MPAPFLPTKGLGPSEMVKLISTMASYTCGRWRLGVEQPRIPKLPSETWYLARTVSSRHVILVTIHDKERHFIGVDNEGQIIDEVMSKAKL